MMTQFVPSQIKCAHEPEVKSRIAVPAAPPARGTTFELAEFTKLDEVCFIHNTLPADDAGVGRVKVKFPATLVEIKYKSVEATEYVVVLIITGALKVTADDTDSVVNTPVLGIVAAIVIEPAPFVIVMFDPAVKVAGV